MADRPDPEKDDVDSGEPESAPNKAREELSDRERQRRLEEIRQYLRDRQRRLEVIEQTETPSGQILNWVPIESQVRHGKIDRPPAERLELEDEGEASDEDAERLDETQQFELMENGARRGPRGTVPVLWRDVESLHPSGTLQDFLSKSGYALRALPDLDHRGFEPPEDASTHQYAYSAQYVTCYGGEGYINAWDPYVNWSNEFSLGQVALARGSGEDKQTIEAGHQEYRDLYGDWVPHLFVFYTTNGYTSSGDNRGGYNQDVDGWVQYSSSVFPGARSSPLSQFDSTQYIMKLKWQLWEGNWWLRVNGVWAGYYPASLFNTSGLRNQAGKIAWYGEVVDSTHEGTTATDMGNGHWPYEGWGKCAYMRHLYYQSSTSGTMSRYDPSSTWASNDRCYDIEGHFDNLGSWGPYFYWGGSGKNSQCP